MHRFLFICFFIGLTTIQNIFAEKRSTYIYNENSINPVSKNQINAIEFLVPITQINFPPNQLMNVFNEKNQSISYVNNNKTILFYTNDNIDDIQFMVTLKNGAVLSLHFKCEKSLGKIIKIPETMSGQNIENNYSNLSNSNKNYDNKIKSITYSAFFDNYLGKEWIKTRELINNRYKNINIEKYTEWDNFYYKIKKWDICSLSKNKLKININNLFKLRQIKSITIGRKILLPNECTKLVILYRK